MSSHLRYTTLGLVAASYTLTARNVVDLCGNLDFDGSSSPLAFPCVPAQSSEEPPVLHAIYCGDQVVFVWYNPGYSLITTVELETNSTWSYVGNTSPYFYPTTIAAQQFFRLIRRP